MKTTDSENTRVSTVQCSSYRAGATLLMAASVSRWSAPEGRSELASSVALAPMASPRASKSSDSERQLA